MNKLFSYEGLYYRIFSFIANLILVNLLFWLSSLTIILIGPALIALYRTIYQMIKEHESAVSITFIQNLRDNFKRGLVLTVFIPLLLVGIGAGTFVLFNITNYLGFLAIVFFGLSLLFICTFLIIYSVYSWPLKKAVHETFYVVLSSSANSIILLVIPALTSWFMIKWGFFLFIALGVAVSACLQLFFFIKVLEENDEGN
ncbi:hypothetical protein BAU15_07275 [Enterococcus sp. JM4C]|uniref:DUF624 domain-containing protein n=1 Tax=Candidatus Enterococcus huntleyi TaxID=1857217 RepID=UPI001379F727|nr:DUF624 domain-containing protein [Enterococcus sp. JM4C]KAF1297607.1 hypothetical protein BAU15_07275 [Enterococcus sp. JM4C]